MSNKEMRNIVEALASFKMDYFEVSPEYVKKIIKSKYSTKKHSIRLQRRMNYGKKSKWYKLGIILLG